MQKPGTRAVLAAAALAAMPSFAAAAITVQTTTNANTMVNNLVPSGSGIAVVDGSATYTGAAGASGTFTGADFLGTGFTSGVVLTTGMANNLDGPNTGQSDFSDDKGIAGTRMLSRSTARTMLQMVLNIASGGVSRRH